MKYRNTLLVLLIVIGLFALAGLARPVIAARLAYCDSNQKHLMMVDLTTRKVTKLSDARVEVQTQTTWSSDGKYIAFDILDSNSNSTIYKLRALPGSNTSVVEEVDYPLTQDDSCPCFVGNSIAYCRYINNKQGWVIMMDSKQLIAVGASSISATRDGKQLCYSYDGEHSGTGGFALYNLTTRQIRKFNYSCENAFISPSGKKVIFGNSIEFGDHPYYCLVNLVSGKKTKLSMQTRDVCWETDDTLLYQSDNNYLVRYHLSTGKKDKLFRLPGYASTLAYTPK